MNVYVVCGSKSFEQHVIRAVASTVRCDVLPSVEAVGALAVSVEPTVVLVHQSILGSRGHALLAQLGARSDLRIGVGSDHPKLAEMLELTGLGARAYFNSYMLEVHYLQMLEFLGAGQTWYVPSLLEGAIEIARNSIQQHVDSHEGPTPASLTAREQEIAMDVAKGLSNREIALARTLSERTVKKHLTQIFKKYRVHNRTHLALEMTRHDSQ